MRRARSVILLSGRMRLYGLTDRGGARLPFPRTTRKVSSSLIYASRNRDRARVLPCRPDGDGGRRTEKAKRHCNFNPPITRTRYSSSSRWLVSRHASVELVIFTPRIARHVACRARHACAHYVTHYAINPASVPSRCMKSGKLESRNENHGKIISTYAAEISWRMRANYARMRADAARVRRRPPRGTLFRAERSASDRPRGTNRPSYLLRLSHEGDPKMHTQRARERTAEDILSETLARARAFPSPYTPRNHAVGPIPGGDKATSSI